MIFSDDELIKFLNSNINLILQSNRLPSEFKSVWDSSDDWINKLSPQHSSFLRTKNRKHFLQHLTETCNLEVYLRTIAFLDLIYKHDYLPLHLSIIEESIKNKKSLPGNFSMPILIFGVFPQIFFSSKHIADAGIFHGCCEKKPEYKKAINHLDYLNSLFHYLDAFTTFHPYLYLKGKRYRDHLLHSIRVTWLMLEFFEKWKHLYLKSCYFRLKMLLEDITPHSHEISWTATWDDGGGRLGRHGHRNCIITGLFHDICYPVAPFETKSIEVANIEWINNHLDQISKLSIPTFEQEFCTEQFRHAISTKYKVESINNLYENAIEMYKTFNIDEDLKDCFKKNLFNHGVFSSILLNSVFNESIQAISLHNISDKKIDFSEKPLAFMLVICDELQEWGRSLLQENSEIYYTPLETEAIEIKENGLEATINFYSNRKDILNNDKDFSIAKIVLDKFKNLSRLSVSKEIDKEFNIKITLVGLENEKNHIEYSSSSNKWSLVM